MCISFQILKCTLAEMCRLKHCIQSSGLDICNFYVKEFSVRMKTGTGRCAGTCSTQNKEDISYKTDSNIVIMTWDLVRASRIGI
jgi:hypothetical protein